MAGKGIADILSAPEGRVRTLPGLVDAIPRTQFLLVHYRWRRAAKVSRKAGFSN